MRTRMVVALFLSLLGLTACGNSPGSGYVGAHAGRIGLQAGWGSGGGSNNSGPNYSGGSRVYPARQLEQPADPAMIQGFAEQALGPTPDGSQPTWQLVDGPQDIPQSPNCHLTEGAVSVVNGRRFMNVRQACQHARFAPGDVGIPQFQGIPGS